MDGGTCARFFLETEKVSATRCFITGATIFRSPQRRIQDAPANAPGYAGNRVRKSSKHDPPLLYNPPTIGGSSMWRASIRT
jgi:hypothetical protein